MSPRVDVILSTYNGERYLYDQINSILEQSYQDWQLFIRDDCSTDGTLSILNDYKQRYPEKISIIDDGLGRLGPVKSFEQLLAASTAPYVACCDQDDVWLSEKLQIQIEAIIKLEKKHSSTTPLLVHTDLIVVDDQLRLICESFWKYQHLNPMKMASLERSLVQNYVTGCAMMVNRRLIMLSLPFPDEIIMHDWWMSLVAVSEGVVHHIYRTTLKYRQHEYNDIGAKRWGVGLIIRAIIHGRQPLLQSLEKTRLQARSLLDSNILSDHNQSIVEKYATLTQRNWVMRRIDMLRMNYFKYGIIRNIAMFLRI